MAKLTGTAPVLLVRDVVAAAHHYRDVLGFSYDRFYGQPPDFVVLTRDGQYLMLRQAVDPRHVVPHWTVSPKTSDVYFWVSDADALHAEFLAKGAKIDYGPCDKPHGCREFGVQDLDGHDLSFDSCSADRFNDRGRESDDSGPNRKTARRDSGRARGDRPARRASVLFRG